MIPTPLLLSLALLSATAAFATDMYLPVMPDIMAELGASQAEVQLTLSAFFIGMGLGQLFIGPLSDDVGRKRLLLAGAVGALVASVVAAMAPSIGVLIAARLLQGLGGGACVVLARAIVPDLVAGRAAAKTYSLLMAIQGLAPAVAPVIGGLLAEPVGWRGIFWALAALHLVQLVVAVVAVPETRASSGTAGLGRRVGRNYLAALGKPRVWGFMVSLCFGFAVLFSYISASSFVIQEAFGFSPQMYSLIFAVNALGVFACSLLNVRMLNSVSAATMLRFGVGWSVLACTALITLVLIDAPVGWLLVALWFAVAPCSLLMGNSMALATGQLREKAGSVSAVLGFVQFCFAGAISPMMSIGSNAVVTMATSMVVCSCIAAVGALLGTRGLENT